MAFNMNILFRLIKSFFIFSILTVLTQIGGLVYLIYRISFVSRKLKKLKLKERSIYFIALYLISTFIIVPPFAKISGRVPLPYFSSHGQPLKPANPFYIILNRTYVSKKLKNTILDIAEEFRKKHPHDKLVYLDASFPFLDGFPLLPHKSHDDGEKLDLNFIYKNKNGKSINSSPNLLGYGFCEKPKKNEFNQPLTCERKGYWQYNLLNKVSPNFHKNDYTFDKTGNRELLLIIARHKNIIKIFIEPHLKKRLDLSDISKIRFHGCAAVRHDDHIHIQL